jgi:hypothetical protein
MIAGPEFEGAAGKPQTGDPRLSATSDQVDAAIPRKACIDCGTEVWAAPGDCPKCEGAMRWLQPAPLTDAEVDAFLASIDTSLDTERTDRIRELFNARLRAEALAPSPDKKLEVQETQEDTRGDTMEIPEGRRTASQPEVVSAPAPNTLQQIVNAAESYLSYLHSKQPLGTDEFKMIKGRIVTLACILRSEARAQNVADSACCVPASAATPDGHATDRPLSSGASLGRWLAPEGEKKDTR